MDSFLDQHWGTGILIKVATHVIITTSLCEWRYSAYILSFSKFHLSNIFFFVVGGPKFQSFLQVFRVLRLAIH